MNETHSASSGRAPTTRKKIQNPPIALSHVVGGGKRVGRAFGFDVETGHGPGLRINLSQFVVCSAYRAGLCEKN